MKRSINGGGSGGGSVGSGGIQYAPLSVEPNLPSDENNNNNVYDEQDVVVIMKEEECYYDEDPLASTTHQHQRGRQHGGGSGGGGGGGPGTQSKLSATTNLAKCICGAGSFALPHVFLEEGILGGTIALTVCGGLAAFTMQSLANSKLLLEQQQQQQQQSSSNNKSGGVGTSTLIPSYVELANAALGNRWYSGPMVFAMTLSASIGVCSTYLVFIGQTLESLSCDTLDENNVIRQFLPDIKASTWEITTAIILLPLCLLRSYKIFAFTSALGVIAVMGGIFVTLAYGIFVEPGDGLSKTLQALITSPTTPLWPESFAKAFGSSFGTIAYLFCINFLTFPILNSMENPKRDYAPAVNMAVSSIWIINIIFAILCVGFYGNNTQDLVLANLNNGPYLSALKLLLCVDLLFTFPIVFLGGRQLLELAFLRQLEQRFLFQHQHQHQQQRRNNNKQQIIKLELIRTIMVGVAIGICLGLTKIGGFGTVANLVGGVAQGTLAFVMPPAIAIAVAKRQQQQRHHHHDGDSISGGSGELTGQYVLCAFGIAVVSSVTYFTVFP